MWVCVYIYTHSIIFLKYEKFWNILIQRLSDPRLWPVPWLIHPVISSSSTEALRPHLQGVIALLVGEIQKQWLDLKNSGQGCCASKSTKPRPTPPLSLLRIPSLIWLLSLGACPFLSLFHFLPQSASRLRISVFGLQPKVRAPSHLFPKSPEARVTGSISSF